MPGIIFSEIFESFFSTIRDKPKLELKPWFEIGIDKKSKSIGFFCCSLKNKQAAIQKRKAAESAASLQRHDEGTAAASARSAPAASEQHPCAAPAVKVAVSVKRHWGALAAVSDDCDD